MYESDNEVLHFVVWIISKESNNWSFSLGIEGSICGNSSTDNKHLSDSAEPVSQLQHSSSLRFPPWPVNGLLKEWGCLTSWSMVLQVLFLSSDLDETGILSIAGIPPGKSDASGGIGPKHIVTLTSGFSARCRPMRPIFPVEFQLMPSLNYWLMALTHTRYNVCVCLTRDKLSTVVNPVADTLDILWTGLWLALAH